MNLATIMNKDDYFLIEYQLTSLLSIFSWLAYKSYSLPST